MKKYFYITTTLPYVNAKPHIGHAVEFIRADVLCRLKKQQGFDVFFNTGTDEHGQKISESAKKMGMTPKQYVDNNSIYFKELLKSLNISKDIHFIRTTDNKHIKAAQTFWKIVDGNGFIYKKQYKNKYCVGCELEKSDSELVNGKCREHPNREIQLIDEENYFFRFREFQNRLLKFYKKNPNFVIPKKRKNEMINFVKGGLKDFSISRLKSKTPWGIPVPGDSEHVMYVWFDALINYISTLGWPENSQEFYNYWHKGAPTQYCGQDNLRQQTAMWQAMLMAANLPNSHQVIINGFVTGKNGIKMSKSLGNVIDPSVLQKYYGTDAVRYYLLRHIHPFEGSPITYQSFHKAYNTYLANGLGNLSARLLTLTENYLNETNISDLELPEEFMQYMNRFRFDLACNFIWSMVSQLDKRISADRTFELVKTNPRMAKKYLGDYLSSLNLIAKCLETLLPETSDKLLKSIQINKRPASLFERKKELSTKNYNKGSVAQTGRAL